MEKSVALEAAMFLWGARFHGNEDARINDENRAGAARQAGRPM
jgi:hypothetical protein